jgi:hypothetical protein
MQETTTRLLSAPECTLELDLRVSATSRAQRLFALAKSGRENPLRFSCNSIPLPLQALA